MPSSVKAWAYRNSRSAACSGRPLDGLRVSGSLRLIVRGSLPLTVRGSLPLTVRGSLPLTVRGSPPFMVRDPLPLMVSLSNHLVATSVGAFGAAIGHDSRGSGPRIRASSRRRRPSSGRPLHPGSPTAPTLTSGTSRLGPDTCPACGLRLRRRLCDLRLRSACWPYL